MSSKQYFFEIIFLFFLKEEGLGEGVSDQLVSTISPRVFYGRGLRGGWSGGPSTIVDNDDKAESWIIQLSQQRPLNAWGGLKLKSYFWDGL